MSNLQIDIVAVLNDNYCYVLTDPGSGTVAVIDPPVVEPIVEALAARGGKLDKIILTHHHQDHIGGVEELKKHYGAEVIAPAADKSRIPAVDRHVGEGDRVEVGASSALVFETPGHTSGHVSYWFENDDALFCGDTLFVLGCGRLFEGDGATMWHSLSKLRGLSDTTRVFCGHEYTLSNARFALTVDPDNDVLKARAAEIERLRAEGKPTIPSTIGTEKATNPFLRPDDPSIRRHLAMETADDATVFTEIRRRKDAA